jgi:transposase InsO family protein
MREEPAITAFERLFHERGLPLAIRSDNGVPFASPNALFNLSKLSVWWLGIAIEGIKPGHPQQNGRHERMHLTLNKEQPARRAPTACSSKNASTPSSTSSNCRRTAQLIAVSRGILIVAHSGSGPAPQFPSAVDVMKEL